MHDLKYFQLVVFGLDSFYYFPPTYNGVENHNLCCVFQQTLPNRHNLHLLLDYF